MGLIIWGLRVISGIEWLKIQPVQPLVGGGGPPSNARVTPAADVRVTSSGDTRVTS